MNILGVIPARGGSKGIPKKNLKTLGDKPLIAYTIASALRSKLITRCILSTDSEEIAAVGKAFGMAVPFLRPAEFATDGALAVDVMKHAVLEMERRDGAYYDYVVMLQPTTPLKTASDIDGAIQKAIDTGCDSVVTLVDVGANHPARMYRMNHDRMIPVMDEGVAMKPRQELEPVYIRNGAVYVCKRDVMFGCNALIGPDTRGYVMPVERSVNIDSPADFVMATYYLNS